MKILYLHRTSASDGGGVHIQSLIGALREIGQEIVLIAPTVAASADGGASLKSWIGLIRRRLPAVLHEIAELALNIPESWRLLRAVRRHKPDLILRARQSLSAFWKLGGATRGDPADSGGQRTVRS